MEKKRTYGVWAVRSSTSIFGPAQSWCKENGKPLEFDTKAAAENYAKEANEHTTANVRYYVKEKEPEPGAVRKGTSQPELDARSHEEVIPRNDAAEKQNEIPGRQIPSQTDPLVEIRSAVHSNYAGMVAMLGADNRVYLGHEERCHYQDMQPSYYDNQDGSLCFVCDQPDMYYFLYGEGWAHTQAEMLERGLTLHQYEEFARLQNGVLAQFTTQREILFAGQPFQPPESYLRNAELYEEGQTGNYNMLDGRLNNEPPERPDLTDGQTYEEIRELAPETLPEEKPSLMERLKAERPEHEAKQAAPPCAGKGTLMGAVKFEGVDVLDFLGKVVELHTQHYKDDFDIDKELIQNLAACRNGENEQLLWMSRTCGTYCLWERDVYLQDSHENKVWRFYHEQTKDSILAYAIQLDGIQDGKVTGCIWPLDYHAHVERVKLLSCAIEKVSVLFQDGTQAVFPYDSYIQQINMFKAEHGTSKCVTWLPESERELQTILRREHVKRDYHAKPGDIQEYMDSLKKSTLRGKLKEVQAVAAFTRKPPSHKKEPER